MSWFLGFLCLLSVHAHALDFGPHNGKINNHTSFDNSMLEISVNLECREWSFVGPRPFCGIANHSATVNPDGTFEIPALEVPDGYENSLRFEVMVKSEFRGELQNSFRGWIFYDREAAKAKRHLRNFTIFETVPTPIEYITASPRDEFLAGKGRDVYNTFRVFFPDAQRFSRDEDVEATDGFRVYTDNGSSERPGELPHTVFIVAGDLPANATARIKGEVSRRNFFGDGYASLDFSAPYSKEWAPEQRRFELDENSMASFPRTIDGDHTGFTVEFIKNKPYERNKFDAELSVRCVDGRVEGVIRVASRPAAAFQYKGESALSGSCAGEVAAIEFILQVFNNEPAQKLTLKVDRISRGNWLVRSPTDRWDYREPKGAFTSKLPIFNEAGEPIGSTFFK